MFFRKTVFASALVLAAVPAAFASSGSTWVSGERGFEFHASTSTKSRADVQKELEAFRKNPVAADEGKIVNTDTGYIAPRHSYAFQGGKLVHADSMAHNTPKPSLAMTDAERQLHRELYSR